MTDAVIVSAVRTAVGKAPKGTLRATRPDEMAATVIAEALSRAAGIEPAEVEDVMLGCAMPEGEQLKDLAAHGCTMVIFLSITRMTKVVRELTSSGYTEDTPVAVVYRVGWPDELVIRGTLKDIASKVRAAKITLQALIIVGDAVDPGLDAAGAVSHLYSADYTHRYRRGSGAQASGNGKG